MKAIEASLIKTHKAAKALQAVSSKALQQLLMDMAAALEANQAKLLKANALDLARQTSGNPRNDRLLLNEQRIGSIAASMRKVAKLPDPTGEVLAERTLPNGIQLKKISVPLGVVGAIYESRPNVTFDIAALCLRSRNAAVLKGSSEAATTNALAVKILHGVLKAHHLPTALINLLPPDREVVQELFKATRYLDVLIPRGSDQLIQFVRSNSRVPVIETGAGVCHVYVEKKANLEKALAIIVNAKTSRPSVCNAADTILIDAPIAARLLEKLQPAFAAFEVEIFADPAAHRLLKGYPFLRKAAKADFGREFLSMKCAIKIVAGIDQALEHIDRYSTKHSEAIVSEDKKQCSRFIREVDAAAVYTNASTRFTDGEEFGLGAEIGISTQKLHARGPFALEKLVTEKWILQGDGQVR
ncbi:glutamate-5-semialdehyde dehydrogenase [Flavihumibacter sp. CACIAM 22H1]|uniref:glutamate-5-semialdehyde dehydrogenase n=1 Tax=Flavihumibacter sp. CACIAM 22H1 TaxID=1812911 RepID=UPI0007A7E49B|nr:glutamate-5-semialdehyde dehydrogenase [Flavihumibacter sp. CACIAM 22H1]KYP13870.1 MAG: gamma-glutamyl-phosphate reductase [Flavihumibacter sp. CACIAM 22H1]